MDYVDEITGRLNFATVHRIGTLVDFYVVKVMTSSSLNKTAKVDVSSVIVLFHEGTDLTATVYNVY